MRTSAALEEASPLPFDIARQVRVFESYIQYVEISLRGCVVQRYRLEVPKAIQGLDRADALGARLRTTFEVIDRDSKVSSKVLEDELKVIRDNFTRPLGRPWGRVILRSVRTLFDKRIFQFRERLEEHRQSVKASLEEILVGSRQQLVDYFLPFAEASPPHALLGQIAGKPSPDQVRAWLDAQLSRVFPQPHELLSEMTLDVQFRDVTYETLNEEGFAEKLKDAYPQVDWEKPFMEFEAARAREVLGHELAVSSP